MKPIRLTRLFALALALHSSGAAAQTISDRIYDVTRKPGTPVILGVLGEPVPLSIEELTKRSDLVVEARVSRLDTYINAADTAVITDFQIDPIRVLAGKSPVTNPLVLRTFGGEVVKDGVTIRAENHEREPLQENVVYLFFLTRFGSEAGVYQIYNVAAFERSNDVVRPLARQGTGLYREFSTAYRNVVALVLESARVR